MPMLQGIGREAGLAILVVVLAAAASWRWQAGAAAGTPPAPLVPAVPAVPVAFADSILDEAVALTVDNDPFRLSNRPADVPFAGRGSTVTSAPGTLQALPPRPSLSVSAIVGGPPWSAVLAGIPGRTGGAVVSAGDRIEGLRIIAVSRDSVVIQAADTTWRLALGGPST